MPGPLVLEPGTGRETPRGWHLCGLGASARALKSAGLAFGHVPGDAPNTQQLICANWTSPPRFEHSRWSHTLNENIYTKTSLESRR